jgi:hypothetical protein
MEALKPQRSTMTHHNNPTTSHDNPKPATMTHNDPQVHNNPTNNNILCPDHWSPSLICTKTYTSIVYKSEAGSHWLPPDSRVQLLYRFVLQMVVFRLGYVSDRASFTITKIEAYKKNFEQKIWSIMAL